MAFPVLVMYFSSAHGITWAMCTILPSQTIGAKFLVTTPSRSGSRIPKTHIGRLCTQGALISWPESQPDVGKGNKTLVCCIVRGEGRRLYI